MRYTWNAFDWVVTLLLIAGGINWGLVGAFNYNLVEAVAGNLSNLVYMLVGLSALYMIYSAYKASVHDEGLVDVNELEERALRHRANHPAVAGRS